VCVAAAPAGRINTTAVGLRHGAAGTSWHHMLAPHVCSLDTALLLHHQHSSCDTAGPAEDSTSVLPVHHGGMVACCIACRLLVEEQSLVRVRAEQESLLATMADASSYGTS
jgi:hypothetical protein